MSRLADNSPIDLVPFAAALGWSELVRHQHLGGRDIVGELVWYESGQSTGARSDFFLQINETPKRGPKTFEGAVYAIRYRLCSGWHPFTLFADEREQAAEVERVSAWLHRRWYETLPMRREFRRLHPECANYSWSRVRAEGSPSRC